MKILIDGYNLIFECGLHGKRVNSDTLARARESMLRRIGTAFSQEERSQVVVVFDAKKIPLGGQQTEEHFAGIRVLYAIEFEDADTMIESLILQHSSPKQLLVVSSDHRLQKAALKRRARTIDSGDWYDQLESRRPGPTRETTTPNDNISEAKLLTSEDMEIFKEDVDKLMDQNKRRFRKR